VYVFECEVFCCTIYISFVKISLKVVHNSVRIDYEFLFVSYIFVARSFTFPDYDQVIACILNFLFLLSSFLEKKLTGVVLLTVGRTAVQP